MTEHFVIIVLLVLACVSPLLTWLHLWQVKEWRWDRLLEHMKREGGTELLLSPSRAKLAGAWLLCGLGTMLAIAAGYAPHWLLDREIFGAWFIALPIALAAVGTLQFALRKQPLPRWTMKARMMAVMACGLNLLIIAFLLLFTTTGYDKPGNEILVQPYAFAALLIPFLQPQIASVAWLLTYPLDRFLKRRIMNQARAIRTAHPQLTVIAVTGSVGKTTTKELLSHILADRKPLVPPDHVNTEMGVSIWIRKTLSSLPTDSTATMVVEMGAYRMGEIALLCSIVQPTIGIITRIAQQHLALFGSQEAIAQAKGELFASLPETGRAFVNADSPMLKELTSRCRCPVTTVATDARADIVGLDIEETSRGLKFTADGTAFETGLHGTHNVTNILLAIGVAKHVGLPLPAVVKRLQTFSPPKRTFQVRHERGVTVLDDSYNCSTASMAAAVEWAKQQPAKRKILVTSGIIELGEAEEKLHREIAAQAQVVFEHAYVLDSKFLPYFQDGGFGDRASALPANLERLKPDDLLVCVGRMPQSVIEKFLPLP